MDRVIQVAVNGGFIRKDSKSAGVRGEANVTTLHITMSEDWRAFSKRIVWRDALGEHPVAVVLYNSVEDLAAGKDPLVFDTVIPAEPLDLAGWCSFTIEGFREGTPAAVAITVTDRLEVQPNDAYDAPAEPTPTQAQQLQGEINAILPQVTELVTDAVERLDQANEGWAAQELLREDAEKTRQAQEAARVQAETQRLQEEAERQEKETAREAAENDRRTAEAARAAAEAARADEHTGLVAQAASLNEDTASSRRAAEEAAGEANEAKKAAQDSAAQALQSAQSAQEYSGKPPVVGSNGNWQVWNAATGLYEDTGKPARGEKGDTGPQGIQGIQGEVGPQGPQGVQGETGPQGEKGDTGPRGPQGIQGEVGPKGDTGSGFLVMGYYATAEELGAAQTAPSPGDAYGVGTAEPYDIYIWDGINQAWVNNGALQGPRGEQGIQGPQGDTGAQGIQGIQGETGPQGEKGDTGPQGPQGEQGEVGPQGERGPQGIQGETGPQGPQGDTGPQGEVGPKGPQGLQGPQGETGPQGPQGQAGQSAYKSAQNGGYTGTEAQFNSDLAQVSGKAPVSHKHAAGDINSGTLPVARGGTGATSASAALTNLGAAPAYSYGTSDLVPGSSSLATGKLYFFYE